MTVELSLEEKNRFVRDGALIRKSFVSPALVQAALRAVKEWYDRSLDPSEIDNYSQKTFAPNLGDHRDLLNVYYHSGLTDLAAAFVSPEGIRSVSAAQIQIRVPDELRVSQSEKSMHVDGVACPHLEPTELRTFTLLAGVLLTEVNDVSEGALRYLPGAHIDMARWFREDWKLGARLQVPPAIGERPGIPFLGRPGDVILLHHLTPHAVGANRTTKPRIMVYFRVKHERHDERMLESLYDPWLEFPALRDPQ
jgi:hypothetical protein